MDSHVPVDRPDAGRNIEPQDSWNGYDNVWPSHIAHDAPHSAAAPTLWHQAQTNARIQNAPFYSSEIAQPGHIHFQNSPSFVAADLTTGSHVPLSEAFSPPVHSHDLISSAPTPQGAPESTGGFENYSVDSPCLKRYFCPHLQLHDGKVIRFGLKHDWKRHEKDFHQTGEEWTCTVLGCTDVFSRQKEFTKHWAKKHKLEASASASQVSLRILPEKRVYACGFEDCSSYFSDWSAWIDHVARHMKKEEDSWSYDNQMTNLLRHSSVRQTWSDVVSTKYSTYGNSVGQLQLTWNPETTRKHKELLECQTYGYNLKGLLEELWLLGNRSPPAARSFPSNSIANPYQTSWTPQAPGPQGWMSNRGAYANPPFTSVPTQDPRGQTHHEQGFLPSFEGRGIVHHDPNIAINQTNHGMPDASSLPANTMNECGTWSMNSNMEMNAGMRYFPPHSHPSNQTM